MAKPNLALIPAAQGSKLFSVLPSSGVGDFDFTRSGSATRINSQGLIETVGNGVSRLNYPMIDGKVVGCPHHILEPQRSNLIQYSEDFSQSYWTKTRASITSNSIISPDGTLNASKLIEDTANGSHFLLVNPVYTTSSVNNVVSLSLFAKKSERDLQIQSYASGGGENPKVNFDLTNGTTNSVGNITPTFSIESFGNDWYRCTLTYTVSQSGSGVRFYISMVNNNNTSYQGDGTSGIYIWGAMLEQGSYATSYIPTNGEVNGVTRQAESANGSGDAATFNDSEGVLMAEFSVFDFVTNSKAISIYKTSSPTTNAVILYYNGNRIAFDILNPSGTVSVTTNISNAKELNKVAIKYKSGDIALWFNGVELVTRTNTLSLNGLDKLEFDFTTNNDFYGKTKQLQYYDSALTDSELEQLTSWTSFTDMAEGQLYTIE